MVWLVQHPSLPAPLPRVRERGELHGSALLIPADTPLLIVGRWFSLHWEGSQWDGSAGG